MGQDGTAHTAAIVLAAGQGRRMKGKVAKQYLLLEGKPILYYSLKAFQDSRIDDVILVASPGDEAYVREEIVEKYGFSKVRLIVSGGKERFHSVQNGLDALARWLQGRAFPEGCYVLIHDGARPFLDQDVIERVVECVEREKACVAAMPVKDTVKLADSEGYIALTPPRRLVWTIQTPQAFEFELARHAYQCLKDAEEELLARGVQVTDDAGVVELFTNKRVKLVQGSYENIKITTPDDLAVAEGLLSSSKRQEK